MARWEGQPEPLGSFVFPPALTWQDSSPGVGVARSGLTAILGKHRRCDPCLRKMADPTAHSHAGAPRTRERGLFVKTRQASSCAGGTARDASSAAGHTQPGSWQDGNIAVLFS